MNRSKARAIASRTKPRITYGQIEAMLKRVPEAEAEKDREFFDWALNLVSKVYNASEEVEPRKRDRAALMIMRFGEYWEA